jgi:osmotically inducible protein OsmC
MRFENTESGFAITRVHLEVNVRAPGADCVKFNAAAVKAKTGCPVSKVLNAAITMNANLAA